MKSTKIKRRNVPEFEPPKPKFIETPYKKIDTISESEMESLESIDNFLFQEVYSKYIYEINFPKNCRFKTIDRFSLSSPELSSKYYSISFPPSLENIEKNAFYGCHFLHTITFQKNNSNQNNLHNIESNAFRETMIESISLPNNILKIGSYSFPKTLKSIEFEDGAPKLKKVGKNAFNQTHIESFKMPYNISALLDENSIFFKCKNLKTIIFDFYVDKNRPNSIDTTPYEPEYWDEGQYRSLDRASSLLLSQTKIENLEIFASNLNNFYFFNTPKLTKITVPKGSYANYVKENGCLYTKNKEKLIVAERNLKSVNISSSCKAVTNYAFNIECLEKVSFEKNSGLQEISFFAFMGSPIQKIAIPETVSKIDYGAFFNCKNLSMVNIPRSILIVDFATFAMTSLSEIKIPKSVNKIKYGSFFKCTKLSKVLFEKDSKLSEFGDFSFAFSII